MTLLDRKLQCPNCSVEMQIVQKNEIDIDYCPECKGVWLDRGEIDKIASIQNKYARHALPEISLWTRRL